MREFLDFCPILDHSGNTTKKIDAEKVIAFLSESGGFIDKFTSNYLFNPDEGLQFADLLELSGGVKNVTKKMQVVTNELELGKNYISKSDRAKAQKTLKSIQDEIMEKAKVVTKRIPAYVLFVHEVETFDAMLATDKQDFEEHFDVTVEFFNEMLESGFINGERLNRFIGAIVNE